MKYSELEKMLKKLVEFIGKAVDTQYGLILKLVKHFPLEGTKHKMYQKEHLNQY